MIRSREGLRPQGEWFPKPPEAEGGCGVTGFACTVPVRGKHIYEPSIQMRNRGNGKGGGIAACGLVPEDFGVSRKVLDEDYCLQVALLDPSAKGEVEKEFIEPYFTIDQGGIIPTVKDFRDVPLLEQKPPDVARYFVRVKSETLDRFAHEKKLTGLTTQEIEDEFVYQNSNRLNAKFYASLGDKRAFVLSHARNLIILKVVGFAEAVVQYYCMENSRAHVWIAHQRYPTRGRVWHPGGCHPFIGMHEALVHNGDFANYSSVCEYLAQRNLFPQFLTDTEASIMLFDLMNRTYKYPIEYIIESLAPDHRTRLRPPARGKTAHLPRNPGSPDPLVARTARGFSSSPAAWPRTAFSSWGSRTRPCSGPRCSLYRRAKVSIGLICSEKQAIDATLASLASEDPRFSPIADMYWNARGGSSTDGGAFLLNVTPTGTADGNAFITLGDQQIRRAGRHAARPGRIATCQSLSPFPAIPTTTVRGSGAQSRRNDPHGLYEYLRTSIADMDYNRLRWCVNEIADRSAAAAPAFRHKRSYPLHRPPVPDRRQKTQLGHRHLPPGARTDFQQSAALRKRGGKLLPEDHLGHARKLLRAPRDAEKTLLVDARGFQPEGRDCDASLAVDAYHLGWRHIIHYNSRGTRFHAAGFGPATDGLRVDCYDNPGDYLGSGHRRA